MKRRSLWMMIAMIVAGCAAAGFVAADDSAALLKIYQGIDLYTKVYKEIAVNYVEEIDPEELMRAGIDGMLKTLDPYTVFLGEKEGSDMDLVTSGKYGGIGVTIGMRDGDVTLLSVMEDCTAAKQGMQTGDRILEVDGKPIKGMPLDDVRLMVRGVPGTSVKLKVAREGEPANLEFLVPRQEVSVHNVTYTGYAADGIGYIKLEHFSRSAGEDVRSAVKELQASGSLRGIVIDVRDNPGGLLESAVEIVSKFVPEKSLVVSTRGRKLDSEHKYYSGEAPMVQNIPIAVLVNRNSASASEIVIGAIQDLDAGIVVGTRSFGKGLVQTITPLTNDASLKMTTARYYTPSGRCIQELDYGHRAKNGDVPTVPDSLRHSFLTVHHRLVWDGGGIMPDTTVTDTIASSYLGELYRKSMFAQFANHYAAAHKTLPETFTVDNVLIEEFGVFLKEKKFDYQEEGESKLKDLRTLAKTSRYDQEYLSGIDKLESMMRTEKQQQLHKFRKEIAAALRVEIIGRIKGEHARMTAALSDDTQLQVAIQLLNNKKAYSKILNVK